MGSDNKVLQFPVRNPSLFSAEVNYEILSNSEFNPLLAAAIRALPHIQNLRCREELRLALCELILQDSGAA